MVIRPDHTPPSGRWTPARKEAVVGDVREGRITFAGAVARYALSAEELASWIGRFERHGRRGLAITDLQVRR